MSKKIAIIHDWLEKKGGAEKVLEDLLLIYPNSDLFLLADFMKKKDRKFLKNRKIKYSFIQYLPFAKKIFRFYFVLMPLALRFLDFNNYDIIISNSHSFAKNIIKNKKQIHISYCHTPVRYAHVMMNEYIKDYYGIKNFFLKNLLKIILNMIKTWDINSNKNVDHFIANSEYLKKRIKKIYNRTSTVIHPPVDTDKFIFKIKKKNFYLTASRLVPYKKIDIIIKAFNKLPQHSLHVIGDGPKLKEYKNLANSNIKVTGWADQKELIKNMQNSKCFIFAALEDFGIVPVEAQSCGTPVIAYGKGGALDTVVNYPKKKATGIFFKKQTPNSIIKSINLFEKNYRCFKFIHSKNNSLKFSRKSFRNKFKAFIDSKTINIK